MLNWRNQAISLFDRYRHLPVELGRIHFAAGIHPPPSACLPPLPHPTETDTEVISVRLRSLD